MRSGAIVLGLLVLALTTPCATAEEKNEEKKDETVLHAELALLDKDLEDKSAEIEQLNIARKAATERLNKAVAAHQEKEKALKEAAPDARPAAESEEKASNRKVLEAVKELNNVVARVLDKTLEAGEIRLVLFKKLRAAGKITPELEKAEQAHEAAMASTRLTAEKLKVARQKQATAEKAAAQKTPEDADKP